MFLPHYFLSMGSSTAGAGAGAGGHGDDAGGGGSSCGDDGGHGPWVISELLMIKSQLVG